MSPPIAVWKTSLPGSARGRGAAWRGRFAGGGGRLSRRRRGDLLRHGQIGRLTEQPDIGCGQPAVIVFFAVSDPQPAAVSAFPFGPERLGAGDLRHDRGVGARLGAQGERQTRAQRHEPILRRRQRGEIVCVATAAGASAAASAGVGAREQSRTGVAAAAVAGGTWVAVASGASRIGVGVGRAVGCAKAWQPLAAISKHDADNENPAKPVRSIFQDSFPIHTITHHA